MQEISEDLIAARMSRTYERRITVLENGLNVELNEFKNKQAAMDRKVNSLTTKEEAFKISYRLATELAQNVLLKP